MPRRLPVVESRSAVREVLPPRPDGFAERRMPLLADAHGRHATYLRLSVTDRCDLACVYCMPPGGELDHGLRRELLDFEEVARVVSVFGSLGVDRVRFTGGEPLVRKDVVRLVELVHRRSGIDDLAMTTNAMRLAELAGPLARAGLRGANVSIDSLDAERFARITRGGDLSRVLAGIHAALDAGLEVKLNTVVLGGVNDDEVERIVDFAWSHGVTPRFIELMPIGEGANLAATTFIATADVVAALGPRLSGSEARSAPGRGPARYLGAADGSGRRVGFITAVSDDFCSACNRVRVTARGDIRACLASRRAVSLRDVARAGGSDADLAWAMCWALGGKDTGHHFLDPSAIEHARVGMSLIGG